MNRVVLPTKLVNETLRPPIDLASQLAPGETISTASSATTVYSGVDANPSAVVLSTAFSGTVVTPTLAGGVAGCIYAGITTITTSLGATLKTQWFLAVLPDQA